ncbi:nicotinate phosphoribosyltransferase [Luteimonas sp. BDR2-5]|uniref:nicotinate phosphoribosyltransferase n=1 Tax=Proluteimonas luteida TaxID=2878685 RepID=UPI001E5CC8F9|nr:nicotinate phosphoribosyltransferase [Luteimonas sp. BDR2-5]MCD9027408.1 nicotinate phosphoribosyltransferase [Luteimonas sp. BDR2-5]
MPIIQSLLDTDLYKFTMMQAVLHQHPAAHVEYRFRCRTPGIDLARHLDAIEAEIDHLCNLRFDDGELDYLRGLRFLKSDFVDFLSLFQFRRKYITLRPSTQVPGEIELEIAGPWLHTILFEVPLLAIVNEVYFRRTHGGPDQAEGLRRLQAKIDRIHDAVGYEDCRITDFGTRRRYSRAWQEAVVPYLARGLGEKFAGTSNVDLARRYGLVAQGTMAHEWLQAFQALGPRLRDSQSAAFDSWAREYRGDLGIALTDVIGLDAFVRDFDLYFCKLFDGMRHDSGDPVEWGERLIAHLAANKVDPRGKVFVFSDGLDVDEVMRLYAHFRGRCLMSFGIGTNLTNDVGPTPLQIVLKMVRCNGQPVAKLSDSPGKTMCDDVGYLAYLRQVFEVRPDVP